MIIVRLLSPERSWLVGATKVYSGTGADIVMESITLKPPVTGSMSEMAILRQLRIADAAARRIFLSLQVKELFDGTIALVVWEHR
jgi:hypothetical protein